MFFNQFQGNSRVDNDEYYNLLGVDKNSDKTTIKKAYHKLAVKCHPDKGGDPDKFKSIAEAFEVLSDPDKKKLYDSGGKEALNGLGTSNPMDMFSQMFSGNTGSNRVKKGQNTNYTINITLEDVYNGRDKNISLVRTIIDEKSVFSCSHCNGQGFKIQRIQIGPMIQQVQAQCQDCQGSGQKYKTNKVKENIKIYIPKGVSQNHIITIDDKGEDILNGEAGDLIVKINILDHNKYQRQGNDLFLEKKISLLDSISGLEVMIEHIDGRTINIKSDKVINPILFDPFNNEIEWELINKDCKLEPYANAEINDIQKIKDIIMNGQLKDQNINAFIVKKKSTYFYKQSVDEIKQNMIISDYPIYIKKQKDNLMYCIEGEGLPYESDNYLTGDLYIKFIIEFPDKIISNEIKEILIKNNFISKNNLLNDENEEFDLIQKNPSISYNNYKENLIDEDNSENDNINPQQCAQQ